MYLMSSCSDFTGDCELTTKTYGVRCVSETGAKSLMVSNGRAGNRIGLGAMLAPAWTRGEPAGSAFPTLAAPMGFDPPGGFSQITSLPSEPESLSPGTPPPHAPRA